MRHRGRASCLASQLPATSDHRPGHGSCKSRRMIRPLAAAAVSLSVLGLSFASVARPATGAPNTSKPRVVGVTGSEHVSGGSGAKSRARAVRRHRRLPLLVGVLALTAHSAGFSCVPSTRRSGLALSARHAAPVLPASQTRPLLQPPATERFAQSRPAPPLTTPSARSGQGHGQPRRDPSPSVRREQGHGQSRRDPSPAPRPAEIEDPLLGLLPPEAVAWLHSEGYNSEFRGNYRIIGRKRLQNTTAQFDVLDLRKVDPKVGLRGLFDLEKSLSREALGAGATRLKIIGHSISNDGFFSPRLAQRFNYTYQRIDDHTVAFEKELPRGPTGHGHPREVRQREVRQREAPKDTGRHRLDGQRGRLPGPHRAADQRRTRRPARDRARRPAQDRARRPAHDRARRPAQDRARRDARQALRQTWPYEPLQHGPPSLEEKAAIILGGTAGTQIPNTGGK